MARVFSEEHKAKLSEARLRGIAEGRIQHPRGFLGKTHTEESRQKISKNHKFTKQINRQLHSEVMKQMHKEGRGNYDYQNFRWTEERKARFKKTMIARFDKLGRKTKRERTVLCGRQEYKHWRTSVFERDNYTCQDCGVRGVYLEAHHIKSWVNHPECRHDIDNGLTLCKPCHKLTDNYAGKAKKQ